VSLVEWFLGLLERVLRFISSYTQQIAEEAEENARQLKRESVERMKDGVVLRGGVQEEIEDVAAETQEKIDSPPSDIDDIVSDIDRLL